MRSVWMGTLTALLVAMLTLAACGGETGAPASDGSLETTTTAATTAAGGGAPIAGIDPADFSTAIDNLYLPLHRGATFVYEGSDEGRPTTVQVNVLFDTKIIVGVECRAVDRQVLVGDELSASTRGWYAQDSQGNVWLFGEDAEQYTSGELIGTVDSWEAGIDGAVPGIVMKADPAVGDVYQQAYLAGVAEGMAEVLEVDASVEVPYSSFNRVLKIKEWTPLEPGVVVEKYYGPGMGLVFTMQVEGGSDWEQLIDLYGF